MYKESLKHRAIVHYKYFLKSIRKVSSIYNIGKSTLERWLQKDGLTIKRKSKDSVLKSINNFIKQELDKNPFVTSLQLSKIVYSSLGINVSKTTCWRSIRSNNYSFKRTKAKVCTPKNDKANVDLFKQKYLQSTNIVSIDETFFYMLDYPKYGYSKKGVALKTNLNSNPRKKKVTLYMAISEDRIIGYKISITHGNSKDFLEFLQSLNLKNNTLLMDNVAFHKTKVVKDYVTSTESNILFVPPYSPDYNPIELAFSKLKHNYRHSSPNLDNMIENILASINLLRHVRIF